MRNAPSSLWIAFSVTNGCKTSEIWRRKEPSLSCIRLACMIRFCTCSHNLMKVHIQDTSLPHFSKTGCSLCLILTWKTGVKSKTKFNNIFRRGLVFLYGYFYHHFSTQTTRKSLAKRARCSKKKKTLLLAENISFIQSGINEAITKLP